MNRKQGEKNAQNALDKVFQKPGRGRPQKIPPSEVFNRAEDYRGTLGAMWAKLWPPLSVAETKADVINAIRAAEPHQREQFLPSAQTILEIVKNPKFPKLERTRINYLADSLAARGVVTPRRSRDICARERLKQKRRHRILRVEFYVECSCGYEGPSRNCACLNCGAPIPHPGLGEISQILSTLQFEKFPNEVNDY